DKAGEIRVLGVAHGKRLPYLPAAPTFQEEGYDLVTAIWLGLFAPKGVQAGQLAELRKTAETGIRDPQTAAAIEKLLLVPSFLDYASFEKKVASDSTF